MFNRRKLLICIICCLLVIETTSKSLAYGGNYYNLIKASNNAAAKDVYYHGESKKRWIASAIVAGAMFSSLAVDIFNHFDQCCTPSPSTCRKRDEFDSMRSEFKELVNQVDDAYTEVSNLNTYVLNLANKNDNLWIMMEALNLQYDRTVVALDKDIQSKINETDSSISQLYTAIDAFDDIVIKYNSAFDDVESSINRVRGFISWGLFAAIKKIALMVKQSAAASVVGAHSSKFSQLVNSVSTRYDAFKTATLNRNAVQKMVQFANAHQKVVKTIKTVGSGVVTAAFVAWEIYVIVESFKRCNDMKKQAQEAIEKLSPELEKLKEMELEIATLKVNVTSEYNLLKAQLISTDFEEYINEVAVLAEGTYEDTKSDAMEAAVANIKSYQSQLKTADKDTTETLVENLTTSFQAIAYILSCYVTKLTVVNYATSQCKIGADTMTSIITNAKSLKEDVGCTDITYFTSSEIEELVISNLNETGHQTDCILNNADKQVLVCTNVATGLTTSDIATNINLTTVQTEYFVNACAALTVTTDIIFQICAHKSSGDSLNEVLSTYNFYIEDEVRTAYNDCDLSNETVQVICLKRESGISLVMVQSEYTNYSETKVETAFNECGYTTIDTSVQTTLCMYKNTFNLTLSQVLILYASKYGESSLTTVYNTC